MDGVHVARLNRYYAERKLRILIGGGVSMAAGFPGWDALNQRLLRASLETDPPKTDVDDQVKRLYELLGRESVADFVWQHEDPDRGGDFFRLLAAALYGDRDSVEKLPIPPIVYQLASMANRAKIFTTNYDPILELGLARLQGFEPPHKHWQQFRDGSPDVTSRVRHIHGWLDPDGYWGGSFVLTESQYIALQSSAEATPNRDMIELLDSEGAVLIVGMSLTDANLRRLLYQRSLSPFASAPTYAVVKAIDNKDDARVRDNYWRARKITILSIETHELLLPALRRIQFGPGVDQQRPPWLTQASRAIHDRDPFTDDWQRAAWASLRKLRDGMVAMGENADEVVQLSVFRVMEGAGEIQKVVSSSPDRPRTGEEAREHASQRRLSVRVGHHQGVAGLAFAKGLRHEATNADALNLNFTDAMRDSWKTDFESLVAVPLYATTAEPSSERFWLPIGVLAATSSRRTIAQPQVTDGPCWQRCNKILPLLEELGERLLVERR